MACKPVHLTAAGTKPTGRQAIWEAIRRRPSFTISELVSDTDIHRDTIRTYLRGLEAAHYIKVGSLPGTTPIWWTLVKDVGIEAPRVTRDGKPVTMGAAQEQMWRTMKILSDFTFRDLAISASTEAVMVNEEAARDYLGALSAAGYLITVQKGGPNRPARYRFNRARNTGPKAPMIQRLKTVFDPNTRQVVWQEEARDE